MPAAAQACTIAVRYAAVRKQGFKDTSEKEEVAILDYKFTQYRLLKQLGFAIANKFACNYFLSRLGDFKDLVGGGSNQIAGFDDISELHATAAGMKGFCCERAAVGIEDCRKACGGHGYLLSSGIAALEADYKWRATAEGDTVVMLLETAKYLIKSVQEARKGVALIGLAQCLAVIGQPGFDLARTAPPKPTSAEGWLDIAFLQKLFEARTIAAVYSADQALSERTRAGRDARGAFADCTLQMMRAGECHVAYFMLTSFKNTVEQVSDAACKEVLRTLCALFGLSEVLDGAMWSSLLDGLDETRAQMAAGLACGLLRPNAVALVDCFEYPDLILNSTLGREDGNVYEVPPTPSV